MCWVVVGLQYVAKKRYQAVGFPCNRMLKLSSSRGVRIDVPVLSVSWSFEDHSVIRQALRKGLIEREASDTGGVPRWKSSCPDRLAEATGHTINNFLDPAHNTVVVIMLFIHARCLRTILSSNLDRA